LLREGEKKRKIFRVTERKFCRHDLGGAKNEIREEGGKNRKGRGLNFYQPRQWGSMHH